MVRGKLFRLAVALLLLPSFFLHALDVREAHPVLQHLSPAGEVIQIESLDLSDFNLDSVLQLIEEIVSDEFEEPSTSEEMDFLLHLLVNLARKGIPEGDLYRKELLERDIEELFADDGVPEFEYLRLGDWGYEVRPAFYSEDADFVLCGNWFKKQWKNTKSFVKENQEILIIGTVVVMVVTAVVIAATHSDSKEAASAATAMAGGVGSALASQSTSKDPSEKIEDQASETEDISAPLDPLFITDAKKEIDERVLEFVEEYLEDSTIDQSDSNGEQKKSLLREKAEKFGSALSHEIFDGMSTLLEGPLGIKGEIGKIEEIIMSKFEEEYPPVFADAMEQHREWTEKIHKKIDDLFSTNAAGRYTEEAKAARRASPLYSLYLPPPVGFQNTRIAPTTARSVRGWKVGQPINNLTRLGRVPKWSTVRKRHWKNEAYNFSKKGIKGSDAYKFSETNLKRMRRGLAPQVRNLDTEVLESIELHHIPPQREGGLFNFIPLTPEEHAKLDSHRNLGNKS